MVELQPMSENITKPGRKEASEESVDELNRAHPPIEIGLIVAGRFSLSERRLLQDVEARFKHVLKLRLPEFDWRIAISRRRDIGERGREESLYCPSGWPEGQQGSFEPAVPSGINR